MCLMYVVYFYMFGVQGVYSVFEVSACLCLCASSNSNHVYCVRISICLSIPACVHIHMHTYIQYIKAKGKTQQTKNERSAETREFMEGLSR